MTLPLIAQPLRGQSTIQFGFEEFPLGSRPPFVTGGGRVADRATSVNVACDAFEGQKILSCQVSEFLGSPNGQLIQSYTLHLFFSASQLSTPVHLILADRQISLDTPQLGSWLTFQGSFDTPVQSFQIGATTDQELGFPGFAIDGVEFATVPEPQTFCLLALGLGAIISLPRLLKSRTPPSSR